MSFAESERVDWNYKKSTSYHDDISPLSLIPSLEIGTSNLSILRGRKAIWTLGPAATWSDESKIENIDKWARELRVVREDIQRFMSETRGLLKHIGIPLDMGPYDQFAFNVEEAKAVGAILEMLPATEDLSEDFELSMLLANLLRFIAKSIEGREGIWREYRLTLRERASDIIERHQNNMFGRRNLAFLSLEMGNWKDANKLLDKVIQDMKDGKALTGKGIALKHLGKKYESLQYLEKASEKNPDVANVWRDMGDLYLDLGNTKKAIQCLKKAIALKPTWGEVWEILGYAYEEAGDAERSKECLSRASNMIPSWDRREEWIIYRAALSAKPSRRKTGQDERSELDKERERLERERMDLEILRREIEEKEKELMSRRIRLREREAAVAQQDEDKERVCNLLEKVASLEKENVLAFWKNGFTTMAAFVAADEDELIKAGKTSRATARRIKNLLEEMEDVLEREPGKESEFMEDAMSFLEEGKHEEALESLNEITKTNPRNEEAWFNKAEIFSSMGKTKEALNCYERTLELNPKNQRAWMERANLLMQEGFPVEAISSMKRFLELDPENAKYLRERAEAYSQAGDFGNAILCYNSILQFDENNVDALVGLGDAMLNLSDVEEADRFLQRAIKLAPSDERAWCKRAHILNRKGRWGAAIQLYNRSIALKWNYLEPWLGKAEIHLRQGDYDVAVEIYDRAIKIDSSDPHAWYGKGVALEKKKEYKQAERCYKKALKLDDSLYEAREGLERVLKKEDEE